MYSDWILDFDNKCICIEIIFEPVSTYFYLLFKLSYRIYLSIGFSANITHTHTQFWTVFLFISTQQKDFENQGRNGRRKECVKEERLRINQKAREKQKQNNERNRKGTEMKDELKHTCCL